MHSSRRARGLTLIDLLISLTIVAVLGTLVVPSFNDFLEAQQATATINRFAGAVALARSAAITYRESVVFCPAAAGADRCGRRNTWHEGAMVFADRDGNRRLNGNESLYARLPAFDHGTVQWRSFRNRSYLKFRGTGLTIWQNGNFKYCPSDGDRRHARMLILNYAGRTRSAPDRNRNGIREGADGRDLGC